MARGGEWGPTDVFVTLFSMFSITLPLIVFKKFVFSGKERFARPERSARRRVGNQLVLSLVQVYSDCSVITMRPNINLSI